MAVALLCALWSHPGQAEERGRTCSEQAYFGLVERYGVQASRPAAVEELGLLSLDCLRDVVGRAVGSAVGPVDLLYRRRLDECQRLAAGARRSGRLIGEDALMARAALLHSEVAEALLPDKVAASRHLELAWLWLAALTALEKDCPSRERAEFRKRWLVITGRFWGGAGIPNMALSCFEKYLGAVPPYVEGAVPGSGAAKDYADTLVAAGAAYEAAALTPFGMSLYRANVQEPDEEGFLRPLYRLSGLPKTWLDRPRGRSRLEWLENAEARYRQALDLVPDTFEARLRLGHVLLELGELDEARGSLQQALTGATGPEEKAITHLFLGKLEERAGRFEAAAGEYRAAIGADPRLQPAHVGLSSVLRRAGDRRGAEAAAQAALDRGPDGLGELRLYFLGLPASLAEMLAPLRAEVTQ